MRCPILNPLRFYDIGKMPDWNNYFPNANNWQQRSEVFIGIEPALYYKEYLAGKDIKLQFEIETGDIATMSIYKYDELTETYKLDNSVGGVDITPTGWDGNSIYSFLLNLGEGTYYLYINEQLKSDIFVVVSDSFLKKKLIQINYSNSENDFGCIFNGFSFTNYFSGILDIGQPDNDIEAFDSDYGNLIKLSAIPKRIATLTITDIHKSLIDHVSMIFSLDQITINGINYQNNEAPAVQDRDGSDIVDITVKLTQTDNSYYYE
jgi:hypothetical protein